ncbi:hypothetical protein QZH41_006206, partial [Actinostola sp. cb2023]
MEAEETPTTESTSADQAPLNTPSTPYERPSEDEERRKENQAVKQFIATLDEPMASDYIGDEVDSNRPAGVHEAEDFRFYPSGNTIQGNEVKRMEAEKPFRVHPHLMRKHGVCTFEYLREGPSPGYWADDLNCLSLNVAKFPDSNGQYKCELLNTTWHDAPSKQTSNDNFHHFAIQTKCLSKPCENNGVCMPVYTNDTYNCKCPQNFIGDHCEMVAAEECSSYTIINDETRNVNYVNSGTPKCDNNIITKWYRLTGASGVRMPTTCVPGKSCGTEASGWMPEPHPTVANGISAVAVHYSFKNKCKYSAANIRFPDSNGQYKCELLDTTVHETPRKQTSNDNFHHFAIQTKCFSKPCENNGVCMPVYTNDTYTCKCPNNFIGDHCEMVVGTPSILRTILPPLILESMRLVRPVPLLHTLRVNDNAQRLRYNHGLWIFDIFDNDYTNNIEFYQTKCFSKPCKNNGVCIPVYTNDTYTCKCPNNFIGDHCEVVSADECSSYTIINDETRNVNYVNSSALQCDNKMVVKWYRLTGAAADECSSYTILNDETRNVKYVTSSNYQCDDKFINKLADSNGQYKCELLNTTWHDAPSKQTSNDNFHHFAFQTKCLSKPCENNGVCIPVYTNDTYTCKCPHNFIGDHCGLVAADECSSYTIINDETRNVKYVNSGALQCDDKITTKWYRLTGAAGNDNRGKEYEPGTLQTYRNGLRRYFLERPCPPAIDNFDIEKSSAIEFQEVADMISTKKKNLKKQGLGNQPNAAQPVEKEDVETLWSSGAVGLKNPRKLIHLVWWNNVTHLGMRVVKEHYNCQIQDFTITDQYIEYNERQTKNRQGDEGCARKRARTYTNKIWRTDGGEQDPYRAFVEYVTHRPKSDDANVPDNFYLTPIDKTTSEVWYKKCPIGKNTLAKFMKIIASTAELT